MCCSKLQESENWHVLHDALRNDLQKEVHLTRELLSNLHQEEVSLLLNDHGTLQQILQQRAYLLDRLGWLRLHRIETTEKIERIAAPNKKNPSLDEILPPTEEISAEILSLSDQLMALTERMHRQSSQNQHLTERGCDIYPPSQLAMSQEARPKRKASVATYHPKE